MKCCLLCKHFRIYDFFSGGDRTPADAAEVCCIAPALHKDTERIEEYLREVREKGLRSRAEKCRHYRHHSTGAKS